MEGTKVARCSGGLRGIDAEIYTGSAVVGCLGEWTNSCYCVFDIETTGFHPENSEITEIAVIKYEGARKVGMYHRYLRIKRPLPSEIVALTGITDEKLRREGVDPREALLGFKDFVKGSILVAHNGISFDLNFLNYKAKELGVSSIREPLLDTLLVSRKYFPWEKGHRLKNICDRGGVSYDPRSAHAATYDVEILWKAMTEYLNPKIEQNFPV